MVNLKEISTNLIDFIINSNNPPYFKEFTDLQNKKSFGNIMIEDLGDTLPFLFWSGQKLNPDYCRISDNAAKYLINKYQYKNGFFKTSSKLNNLKIYDFDKMTDLSLGINLMYELTQDNFYLERSRRFFDKLTNFVSSTNGFIPILYFPSIRKGFNFSTGKYGLYIEELCNIYKYTNDKKYLDCAKLIAGSWIENSYFNKNNLFPFLFKPEFAKRFADIFFKKKLGFSIDSAMSSKANTNLIHAINKLYSITKDEKYYNVLKLWYEGVRSKLMCEDGSLYNIWDKNGRFKFLGCDHAVIDCFLDFYINTGEKEYLKDAEKIANFWIRQQDSSGLIRQGVAGFQTCADPRLKFGKNPNVFRLDPQTDLVIVLIKLYQLTRNKFYLDKANNILNGICNYHIYNSGFVDILDENKNKINYIIETKFLFLLLKALMFEHYKSDKKIYNDKKINLLLRDR